VGEEVRWDRRAVGVRWAMDRARGRKRSMAIMTLIYAIRVSRYVGKPCSITMMCVTWGNIFSIPFAPLNQRWTASPPTKPKHSSRPEASSSSPTSPNPASSVSTGRKFFPLVHPTPPPQLAPPLIEQAQDRFHLTRRCSGVKFLPPGLHLITWSPPPSSTPGPSAIPLRSALLHVFKPKERVVLAYDDAFETVPIPSPSEGEVISDDHLKTLDNELAPYPFDGLEGWNALTSHISGDVVKDVLGASGRVDGIMQADGEEDEVSSKVVDGERVMRFPVYRLKRSWRDGAVGEEVTRYARDKSWLMGDVLTTSFESGTLYVCTFVDSN